MIQTLRVMVLVTIRADKDDDEAVREAVKEALEEGIEDDTLNFNVEEDDEEN